MTGRLAAGVMNDLRVQVFAHIQRLSLDFFTEEKAGVIMTRMTSDIEALQQLLQDGLAQFAIQGLTMVVVTASCSPYNVRLALIIGPRSSVPALTVSFALVPQPSLSTLIAAYATPSPDVISDIAESLSGVRVVTAYNRQRNNVVHHRNVLGCLPWLPTSRRRGSTASYCTASDFIGLVGQAALLADRRHHGPALVHHLQGGGLAPNPHPELASSSVLPGPVLPAHPVARAAVQLATSRARRR